MYICMYNAIWYIRTLKMYIALLCLFINVPHLRDLFVPLNPLIPKKNDKKISCCKYQRKIMWLMGDI